MTGGRGDARPGAGISPPRSSVVEAAAREVRPTRVGVWVAGG